MARYGDTGEYALGNIEIILTTENNSEKGGRTNPLPRGVSKKRDKFIAGKMIDGKQNYIGSYDSPEEAHKAYLAYTGKGK